MARWTSISLVAAALFFQTCAKNKVIDCDEEPERCPDAVLQGAGAPYLDTDSAFGVTFTCILLGCEETKTIAITNGGGGTLAIPRVRLDVGASGEYSVDFTSRDQDNPGETFDIPVPTADDQVLLQNGDYLDIDLSYIPVDGIADDTQLLVDWYNSAQSFDAAEIKTARIPVKTRKLTSPAAGFSTTVLDFGYVAAGGLATETLALTNESTNDAILAFQDVTFTNNDEGAFALGDGEFSPANPGDVLLVPFDFSPPFPGFFEAQVSVITDDEASSTTAITLIGTSYADAQLEVLEPADLQFELGAIPQGESESVEVVIRNIGGAALPLLFSTSMQQGALLSLGSGSPGAVVLDPLATHRVELVLNAQTTGDIAGTLNIRNADTGASLSQISVEAFVAAPQAEVNSNSFSLGTAAQGWPAPSETLRIYNTGVGNLSVSSIATIRNAGGLISVGFSPDTIEPGDYIEVPVSMSTQTLGDADAEFAIISNDIDGEPVNFTVTGRVDSCEAACPVANGTPQCGGGSCEVDECNPRFHDTDSDAANGCECREDPSNSGSDIGDNCTWALTLPSIGDKCYSGGDNTQIIRSGNLHDIDDVDVYYIQMIDGSKAFCDVTNDSFRAQVGLLSAPPGLKLCVHFNGGSANCNYGTLTAPAYAPGNEACGSTYYRVDGNYGRDDDQWVTAWVAWDLTDPNIEPVCSEYTIKFRAKEGF